MALNADDDEMQRLIATFLTLVHRVQADDVSQRQTRQK